MFYDSGTVTEDKERNLGKIVMFYLINLRISCFNSNGEGLLVKLILLLWGLELIYYYTICSYP